MKAAIIGVSGFLGKALAGFLLDQGWEVAGYSRRAPQPMLPGLEFTALDAAAAAPALAPGTDAVFYLSQCARWREFPAGAGDLFGVNVAGVARCAEAALQAGASVYLHASSGSVYAPSYAPMAEDAPLDRSTPYAASKLMAEEVVRFYRPRLCCTSLRLFGLFGPGQETGLAGGLRASVEQGRAIRLAPAPGEAEPTGGLRLSFTLVNDTARALAALAVRAREGGGLPAALNLAAPGTSSLRQFALELGRALGREPVFTLDAAPRPVDLVADVGLLQGLVDVAWTPLPRAVDLMCAAPGSGA